jgi:hypothetical protein
MIISASLAIVAFGLGTLLGALNRDRATFTTNGAALLALCIVLALGRKIAAAHPPIMATIIIWSAWRGSKLSGKSRVLALAGSASLLGSVIAGLSLF